MGTTNRRPISRSVLTWMACGALSTGCAGPGTTARRDPPPPTATAPEAPRQSSPRVERSLGDTLAAHASSFVGTRSVTSIQRGFPDDCTGFVRAVYAGVGIDAMGASAQPGDNGVTAIYRHAEARRALRQDAGRPGDLVFFRETYDRNRNGRLDDGLTHVGIVESRSVNGTFTIVHRGSAGIVRIRMNLARPDVHRTGAEVLNDFVRRKSRMADAALTGELFAGFAAPEPLAAASVALRDAH